MTKKKFKKTKYDFSNKKHRIAPDEPSDAELLKRQELELEKELDKDIEKELDDFMSPKNNDGEEEDSIEAPLS